MLESESGFGIVTQLAKKRKTTIFTSIVYGLNRGFDL